MKTFIEPNLETIQMSINRRMENKFALFIQKSASQQLKKIIIKEVPVHTTVWMKSKNIMVNKRSQMQKQIYYMNAFPDKSNL